MYPNHGIRWPKDHGASSVKKCAAKCGSVVAALVAIPTHPLPRPPVQGYDGQGGLEAVGKRACRTEPLPWTQDAQYQLSPDQSLSLYEMHSPCCGSTNPVHVPWPMPPCCLNRISSGPASRWNGRMLPRTRPARPWARSGEAQSRFVGYIPAARTSEPTASRLRRILRDEWRVEDDSSIPASTVSLDSGLWSRTSRVLACPRYPGSTPGAESDLPRRLEGLKVFVRLEEGLDAQCVDDTER